MSRRMFKALVLGAMVVTAFAAVVSSASATNWVTNGARSFSATAGTTTLIINSPNRPGMLCNSAGTANGTLNATPTPALPSTSVFDAATVTPTFANCTLLLTATVTCSPATLDATSYTAGTTTTTGDLTRFHCGIAVPSVGCGTVASGTVSTAGVTVSGRVHATYQNSNHNLVVFATGQALIARAIAACDGITGFTGGGTTTANFGSTSTGTGNVTYTVTGSPSIWTS